MWSQFIGVPENSTYNSQVSNVNRERQGQHKLKAREGYACTSRGSRSRRERCGSKLSEDFVKI